MKLSQLKIMIREEITNLVEKKFDEVNVDDMFSIVRERNRIKGWTVENVWHSGAWEWTNKKLKLIIYCTPFWEGSDKLEFHVQDFESDYEKTYSLPWKYRLDHKFDIELPDTAYEYINQFERMLPKIVNDFKKNQLSNENTRRISEISFDQNTLKSIENSYIDFLIDLSKKMGKNEVYLHKIVTLVSNRGSFVTKIKHK